jgi:RND family efflux transporter MFP subunit
MHFRSAVFVFLAVASVGCGGSPPAGGAPGGAPGGAMPATPVEIVTLAPHPVEQTAEFVGTIKSRRSTTIQPQAEGILTRIAVSSGQRIEAGATLFEIDAAPQQAAVASLESIRVAREADAALAKQNAERAATLLKVGAISQQEFDQAATLQKTAEAQLRATDEQIRQQRAELSHYRVVAPTPGVVGDIPVRQGDRVTRATVLTTVDETGALELYVGVPVQQASALRLGLPVRVLDDAGATVATERVAFIAPSVDDGTQTVLIKTPLSGQGGRFRPDQFVRAQVVLSTAPALTIPIVSVSRINAQYFVFVAEGGAGGTVAKQRSVSVGPVVGNEYVVTSGLAAGDRLIVSGVQKIGDGMPVAPRPAGGA